jgi:hypothetical protein
VWYAALTGDAFPTRHLFPLIGIHEPVRMHKDPEVMFKTMDPIDKEAVEIIQKTNYVVLD